MGSWSEEVESPDPRFSILQCYDIDGAGFLVEFSKQDEEGNEIEMPNGEKCESFQWLDDAEDFVLAMAKCLDEGIPWKEEQCSPDARLKLFELAKSSYEVEMADGTILHNGDKVASFNAYWDAVKFIIRTADHLDKVAA